MFLSTWHSNENFRLGALTRASYASPALGATILASQQAIRVFVRAALPRALWIAEVNFHFRVYRETFVLGHFQPATPGQRTSQSCGGSSL